MVGLRWDTSNQLPQPSATVKLGAAAIIDGVHPTFPCFHRGVYFRALSELFALSTKEENKTYRFRVSMLEVRMCVWLDEVVRYIVPCATDPDCFGVFSAVNGTIPDP